MEKKKSKTWLLIVAILAVVIVLFVVLSVAVVITGKGSSSKTTQAVETTEAAESDTVEEPGESATLTFEGFSASASVDAGAQLNASALEDPDGYILPNSGTEELTTDDLANLTAQELTYARNEIYARHGRTFESTELTNYFTSKNWYAPDESFEDTSLSDVENANAQLIAQYQKDNSLEYAPQ